jgi:hypothetical protein
MVDLAEVQTAYYLVAATGVLVAAFYYVYNMRISQRNSTLALKSQEQTLETRQAQLFMQLYSIYESKDFLKDYTDLWRYEYTDINDWMSKYHPVKNPEAYASFMRVGRFYEGVGILVEKKLISMDLVMELMREAILFNWDRLKVYAYGQRELTHLPIWVHFENLANEVRALQPSAISADKLGKVTRDMGGVKLASDEA